MSRTPRTTVDSDDNICDGTVIANRFRTGKVLSRGGFTEIRVGEDEHTGAKVAIKLETRTNNHLPQLSIEYKIYQKLNSTDGFPEIYYYGHIDQRNVLVMQLLGQNLEQVFDLCKRQFSLKTILYIAIQLMTRFEYIHRCGIVYRDVRPESFLLGESDNVIYVTNFGLAKSYIDPATSEHIPMVVGKKLIGTIRFLSLNGHRGYQHSRRDDLESLGYLLMYWLKQGRLPWIGLSRDLPPAQLFKKIFEYKYSIPIETLCHGFPVPFANYLRYVRTLEFKEEPSYSYLQTIFVELFQKENFKDDAIYDWQCLI